MVSLFYIAMCSLSFSLNSQNRFQAIGLHDKRQQQEQHNFRHSLYNDQLNRIFVHNFSPKGFYSWQFFSEGLLFLTCQQISSIFKNTIIIYHILFFHCPDGSYLKVSSMVITPGLVPRKPVSLPPSQGDHRNNNTSLKRKQTTTTTTTMAKWRTADIEWDLGLSLWLLCSRLLHSLRLV